MWNVFIISNQFSPSLHTEVQIIVVIDFPSRFLLYLECCHQDSQKKSWTSQFKFVQLSCYGCFILFLILLFPSYSFCMPYFLPEVFYFLLVNLNTGKDICMSKTLNNKICMCKFYITIDKLRGTRQ